MNLVLIPPLCIFHNKVGVYNSQGWIIYPNLLEKKRALREPIELIEAALVSLLFGDTGSTGTWYQPIFIKSQDIAMGLIHHSWSMLLLFKLHQYSKSAVTELKM